MAWPTIVAMLIQSSFNIIDTIFVGRLSAKALAGVSLSFPIMFFVMALGSGIGVSLTSLVSRALGAKKHNVLRKSVLTGLWLSVFVGLFSTTIILLLGKPILSLMSSDPIVLNLAWQYLRVYAFALTLITVSMTINAIFRAKGDMKTPMIIMIVSAITNIILDPLFIFGLLSFPKIGVAGAALATLISRIVSVCIALILLIKNERSTIMPFKFILDKNSLKEIVRIGFPASSNQIVLSLSLFFLNAFISFFGSMALAAFAIAFRIESLAFLPAMAISNTAMTLIGHSVGKKSIKLAKDIAIKVARLNATVMVSVGVFFFIFSKQIIMVFNSNPSVITIGNSYFKIVPFEYFFLGIYFGFTTAFQAVGNAYPTLILNSLRVLVILLPLAYILSRYTPLGLIGVWIAEVTTSIIVFIIATIWFRKKFERHALKGYNRIKKL